MEGWLFDRAAQTARVFGVAIIETVRPADDAN
jgi:hypothetical protein